jgi:hypothetical protein
MKSLDGDRLMEGASSPANAERTEIRVPCPGTLA